MKSFHYEWHWQAEATPQQLWPLLANTDRTNSEGGLPTLRMLEGREELQPGVQRTGFTSMGVAVEWEEEPSEWVYPRWYSLRRHYLRGPFGDWLARVDFKPNSSGTEIVYSADMTSGGPLGHLVIPVQVGKRLPQMLDKLFRHYFEIARQEREAFASPELKQIDYDATRLESLTQQLQLVVPGSGAAKLAQLIARSDDYIAARLRPYELADALGLSRGAALDLFLHATRAGMLDLQWDLLCPRCRGASATHLALADLTTETHCDSCRISYRADLPQQVELTFRPSPAVRKVELETYCVGGPMRTPHVFMQQVLAPGETRALRLTLPEGSHRLRTFAPLPMTAARNEIECVVGGGDGSRTASIRLRGEGWSSESLALHMECTLAISNETNSPQTVLLEGTAWRNDALTAAEVSTKQAFRDLFATELLRPGENISVGTLCVAFTDLRGSTALYRRIGDAPAFGRVLDHFEVIRASVDAEGGAVVKTMGDAVLAVFQSPAGAIRAMRAAQRELAVPTDDHEPLGLKVGIHSGHCIAVTLNERLDYFGTTLNLGARLTGLSDGTDIIVTQLVLDDAEVHELLAGEQVEQVEAELKGLSDVPAMWRIRPA